MAHGTEPESICQLKEDVVEVASRAWHREGSNDYQNTRVDIDTIVDAAGREFAPVWSDDAVELFPGVTSFTKERGHFLRIERAACPVRVRFHNYFEYVSYDCTEHCHSSSEYFWTRYESEHDSERTPPRSNQ